MKRLLNLFKARPIVTVALALLMAGVFAFGFTAMAQVSDESAVREALTQNAAAFERGDMAALNRLWANDESVTVFESGHANYGWADYRDNHLKPEMAEMKNTKYSLSEIKPRIAANTAWATFKYTISADLKDRRVEASGLGTAVLEKRDGRWQIVHWHTSSSRRAPTPDPKPKH